MERTRISKMAKAGSIESNDILIMISPNEDGIDLDLESVVEKQFGHDIRQVILKTLEDEGVINAKVLAKDKGALDFTIRARVKTCIKRGSEDYDL